MVVRRQKQFWAQNVHLLTSVHLELSAQEGDTGESLSYTCKTSFHSVSVKGGGGCGF